MSTTPPNASDSLVMSPALSATSYDMVSGRSRSPSVVSQRHPSHDNYSDDEIVWHAAESSSTDSDVTDAAATSEDGGYVLLNPPHSPASGSTAAQRKTRKRGRKNASGAHKPTIETGSLGSLEARMELLNLAGVSSVEVETRENGNGDAATQRATEKRRKRKAKKQQNKVSVKTPVISPDLLLQPEEDSTEKASAVLPSTGLGDRDIVDDFSDTHSVVSFNGGTVGASPTLYEEAATYISSFLSNPDAKSNAVCRLTLLQSLIIELGLSTPSLPDTLKSANAFLKAHAFLNIREYLNARQEGPEAVQRAMYPSRSALVKDIRRKRDHISLKWVKKHGLQVLLVGVMYR